MQTEWLRRLAHSEAETEHFETAVAYARRWLALDTLHEPAHRLLMRLFASSGQWLEALRQYQQCVDILNMELASPPEEETTRLYKAIQDNQLAKTPVTTVDTSASVSVLPSLPTLIVGRYTALKSIKQRLGVGGEVRTLTVIQGWPGVGKSTIAALLAHDRELAHQFPDGILWTSLGENPDLSGELAVWADAFKLGHIGGIRKLEDFRALITAALREKRVLLIVDDVWQVEHTAPFRVGGQACALLMTSRLNDVASALAPLIY